MMIARIAFIYTNRTKRDASTKLLFVDCEWFQLNSISLTNSDNIELGLRISYIKVEILG